MEFYKTQNPTKELSFKKEVAKVEVEEETTTSVCTCYRIGDAYFMQPNKHLCKFATNQKENAYIYTNEGIIKLNCD